MIKFISKVWSFSKIYYIITELKGVFYTFYKWNIPNSENSYIKKCIIEIKYSGISKNMLNYCLYTHFTIDMTHVDNSFGQPYLKKPKYFHKVTNYLKFV